MVRFVCNFKDSILHKKSQSVNRRHNTSLPHSRTTETPDLPPQVVRRPSTGVTPCPTWLPELPHSGFPRPPYPGPLPNFSPGIGGHQLDFTRFNTQFPRLGSSDGYQY